jgi:hypothetical protein
MTDRTTIEITVEQRDALKARKKVPRESYHSVMDRLLADDDPADATDADDADEIGEQLASLEKHALHTTDRLGQIEQTLEELQSGRY